MTRGPLLALALAGAALGAIGLARWHDEPRPPATVTRAERPRLALLTSLPLLFGEQFGLDVARPAAIARVEQRFTLVPIALADAASLRGFSRLLMAHPRAQPAEVLVELDQWVRDGGQLVLLADPLLKWESSRPLGDRLRPPPDFADTGLLAHWGLRLGSDEAGEGFLRSTGRDCGVAADGLSARCRVGRGSAAVIADADFIMRDDAAARARLDRMMAELGGETGGARALPR